MIFAYTVKGWGLPIAGNPRNHSALLSTPQVDTLREQMGLTRGDRVGPHRRVDARRRVVRAGAPSSSSARARAGRIDIAVPDAAPRPRSPAKPVSTQESFGRIVAALHRDAAVAPYLVTTAPTSPSSTNLAGFINRAGVFAPDDRAGRGATTRS